MVRIGVLALQGSVIEHIDMLNRMHDVEGVAAKTIEDLQKVDGIILPGGESTTIGKLLKDFCLFDTLKSRIENGLPVWGTCAGMILLAKEVADEEPHLSVMNITVRRNAYGRQVDSFSTDAVIPSISPEPLKLVFIRAPWIEAAKNGVETLLTLDGSIVAARQDHMLVTSFHPELTDSLSVHRYFADMVNRASDKNARYFH